MLLGRSATAGTVDRANVDCPDEGQSTRSTAPALRPYQEKLSPARRIQRDAPGRSRQGRPTPAQLRAAREWLPPRRVR
jgi:hypothetical protein